MTKIENKITEKADDVLFKGDHDKTATEVEAVLEVLETQEEDLTGKDEEIGKIKANIAESHLEEEENVFGKTTEETEDPSLNWFDRLKKSRFESAHRKNIEKSQKLTKQLLLFTNAITSFEDNVPLYENLVKDERGQSIPIRVTQDVWNRVKSKLDTLKNVTVREGDGATMYYLDVKKKNVDFGKENHLINPQDYLIGMVKKSERNIVISLYNENATDSPHRNGSQFPTNRLVLKV